MTDILKKKTSVQIYHTDGNAMNVNRHDSYILEKPFNFHINDLYILHSYDIVFFLSYLQ